ncbi:MAG: hypothetical protein JWM35_722 [Verrucomicrobia bacterium]|nr:hypothetical protein [Verrucomicrobiota bacterium]
MKKIALLLSLAVLSAPLAALAQNQLSDDAKTAIRVQADRNLVVYKRGKQAHYTQTFDLSGLPHYVPSQQVTGWIRLHGNNYLSDGMLGDYWQQAFAKFQPGIRFSLFLPTSAVAFASLYYNQADVAMDHEPGFYDMLAYERVMNTDPLQITVVTGSYNVGGWSNSFAIIVNKDNPITKLSMQQLDGIFGAARDGGWSGTTWHNDWARGPEKNIRTWGQLGLTGEWANQKISLYGFSLRYNTSTLFADKVLQSSDKWNEDIHAYGNYLKPDGTRSIEADRIAEMVGKDPYAIGYLLYRGDRPGTKRLALAKEDGGPYIEHTIENVQNRTYPLFNELFMFANVKPGTPLDPKVKEFLRFILSQEGQAEVARDGKYLPLTAEVVREQLKKLE